MTDERLDELEALCSAETGDDGIVEVRRSDVLELVRELRELRKRALVPSALQGTIAFVRWLAAHSCANWKQSASFDVNVGTRIAIQDPGR